MQHYLTFSEYNYLPLGLTLYESIVKNSKKDFTLHYIVRDNKSFEILSKLPHIKVYKYDDIKQTYDGFRVLENTFKKNLDGFSPFHFMMTPVSINFLLDQGVDHCLYIDADICFYHDPSLIIEACENKSVGICTHKHMILQKHKKDVGYYNVGVVYFKNDNIGKKCAQWWSDVCLNPNNEWADNFGSCGDQKYVEAFEDIIGKDNIYIIDYTIGHGAPWNFQMLEFLPNDEIIWRDPDHHVLKDCDFKHQKMVYNHFSHFRPCFKTETYFEQREGEWGYIIYHPGVKDLYDRYFLDVLAVYKKYNLGSL